MISSLPLLSSLRLLLPFSTISSTIQLTLRILSQVKMPEDNRGNHYTYKNSGTNSQVVHPARQKRQHRTTHQADQQGNHYCTRDYGKDVANTNAYHYSNQFIVRGSSTVENALTLAGMARTTTPTRMVASTTTTAKATPGISRPPRLVLAPLPPARLGLLDHLTRSELWSTSVRGRYLGRVCSHDKR